MAALVLEAPGMIPIHDPGELVAPDLKGVTVEFSNGYGIWLDKEAEALAREGKAIKYSCSGLHGDYQ